MSVFNEGKKLGKCRIRDGAIVGQDLNWATWKWNRDDTVFVAYDFLPDEAKLVAPSYGLLNGKIGAYGNGALYVHYKDIIFLNPSKIPALKIDS